MIKRMYLFMLKSFVPLFVMTFFICLFIVLMQFLWRYIDDLVGKGLSIDVIAELFFYAALTMIPMALPLAILLASLMTFGNLGENFELTAIKAAGVSLIKVMKPLTILMILISIGAFFFQNDVLPIAQTKMWTLLYSMRQKSPELEIPEGVFYDQIPGLNLYVEHKNPDTGTLYDVMIYDMSGGFENARVILADSGKLVSAADHVHLYLTLYHGEQFENLTNQSTASGAGSVPYRRESFDFKEIMLSFDANFNRMDEEGMRNQYVGKNIQELQATIDSVNLRIDSIGTGIGRELRSTNFFGISPTMTVMRRQGPSTSPAPVEEATPMEVAMDAPLDVDSIFRSSTSGRALAYLNQALIKAKRNQSEYQFKGLTIDDDRRVVRRHAIELQKKFTLSFACIIFFFIGAPLGAIIRKGGLGTPLVISVLLFIFYYIIDNTGYKLARDGKVAVWEGMWLSAAVLLPLGIFLTYKAVKDSSVFSSDAYKAFFRALFGIREKRAITLKEVRIRDIGPSTARAMLTTLLEHVNDITTKISTSRGYVNYWKGQIVSHADITLLRRQTDEVIEYLSDTPSPDVIKMLNTIPVTAWRWIYDPSDSRPVLSWAGMILFPIGLPLYLIAIYDYRRLGKELSSTANVLNGLIKTTETPLTTEK
ncbi:MAG: LptF/LptG family permease [Pseudoflavonifractor sp.]|nr:LptF/LptG family permease [Alloprevotella sp.]MCM1116090.1 LptF/LptG family permease [Pseudoflavonifractor sp.]